jgi:hypothetical protein
MLPFLFGALAAALSLVAVFGRDVNCAFYVVQDPYVISMAWTMLLLWPGRCDAFVTCNELYGLDCGNVVVCVYLFLRESSLQAKKTTYSGLQEHRIIVYTATGQKTKAKGTKATETTDTGN